MHLGRVVTAIITQARPALMTKAAETDRGCDSREHSAEMHVVVGTEGW